MLVFRLFGFPIAVHGWFWLTALLIGLSRHGEGAGGLDPVNLISWLVIMFCAVLFHELGHALMARRFGQKPEVHLIINGGVTVWPRGAKLPPRQALLVSIAGPAVGILIGGIALAITLTSLKGVPMENVFGVSGTTPRVYIILSDIILTNLGWALFNLVPVLPLDGGHVIASLGEMIAGERGLKAARWLSFFAAVGLALVGVVFRAPFVVLMMAVLAYLNYQGIKLESTRASRPGARAIPIEKPTLSLDPRSIRALLDKAVLALEERKPTQVRAMLLPILPLLDRPKERVEAQHLVAWSYWLSARYDLAKKTLSELPANIEADPLLSACIAAAEGDYEAAYPELASHMSGNEAPDELISVQFGKAVAALNRQSDLNPLFEESSTPVDTQRILVHELAIAGKHDAAAEFGAKLFARTGDAQDAYNIACVFSLVGQTGEAIQWLERSISAGFSQSALLDSDTDLDNVRKDPAFASLRDRARSGPVGAGS